MAFELPPWAKEQWMAPQDLSQIIQKSIDIYLLSKQYNGEMGGIGWWQSANGYTAMALQDIWADTKQNYSVLSDAIRQCEKRTPNLVNEFNDDTLWWGLCCLHLYTTGGEDWFLEKAKYIWNHIRDSNSICRRGQIQFRGMDMEGGCYWTTNLGEEQINSITTGLFAELSVRLALLEQGSRKSRLGALLHRKPVGRDEYLETARCSLGWILRCRYRPSEAVVLDNILLKKQIPQDWTFTYTTGVVIGVGALLFEATGEAEYMSLACTMAQKAVRRREWVEDNGVLTEHGAYGKGNHDPWQNSDAVGFKAVLMRHLSVIYDVIIRTEPGTSEAVDTASLIKCFVNVNLRSQLERNTNGSGQYGPWWNGPFEMPTSHSQMAVLDIMAAARLVNKT